MYERLRAMYLDGRLNDAGLTTAVGKGWITQAQADQIRTDKFAQDNPPAPPATEPTPEPVPTDPAVTQ